MLLTALLLALCFIPIVYSKELSFHLATLCFLSIGLLSSGQVVGFCYVAEDNPLEITSTALGLVSVIIMLCASLFQPLFGWLLEFDPPSVFQYTLSSYQYALILLPITALVSLVITTIIKETKNNKRL
jgi:hypothetical protein